MLEEFWFQSGSVPLRLQGDFWHSLSSGSPTPIGVVHAVAVAASKTEVMLRQTHGTWATWVKPWACDGDTQNWRLLASFHNLWSCSKAFSNVPLSFFPMYIYQYTIATVYIYIYPCTGYIDRLELWKIHLVVESNQQWECKQQTLGAELMKPTRKVIKPIKWTAHVWNAWKFDWQCRTIVG